MNLKDPIAFRFSGFDAAPCFMIAFPTAFALPWVVAFLGLLPSAYMLAVAAILAAGMRVSVTVSQDSVCITKKWLLIPYRIYRAREIRDVWYGGDWGEEEGADCVVLTLGNAEVNVGSSRSMKYLHDSLRSLSAVGRNVARGFERDSDRADASRP